MTTTSHQQRSNARSAGLMRPFVSCAALLAIIPAFAAQPVDTSEWLCEFCPFESGYRGDYSAGISSVSEDSAYFGDGSGYDEEGVYASLDGTGSWAGADYRARWAFVDLGLDSRALQLDGGRPGTFDYTLAYSELPRRQFDTTVTVLRQADDALLLPPGWVRAPTTGGFAALAGNLASADIGSDRKMLGIGGRYRPASDWTVAARYRRHSQEGTRILGGSYYTSAALLPAAIDYVTDEVDIGVRYAAGGSMVSLGWYLSDFTNSDAAVNWEHPFTTVAGGEFAALAQPPDSRFQQLTLSGARAFEALRAHASFSLAVGTVEQTEAFLPYTRNTTLSTTALPRSDLGGDIDTTRLALAVTARPLPKARVRFSYRYDERDSGTPRDTWNRVIADSFVSGQVETNVPYSFERRTVRASAHYRVLDDVRVSAGYERRDNDYDFQEIAEQSEDTGWGRVRWQALPTLQLDLRGGTSKRDIDRYNEVFAATLGQNPLLRKYNLAYRYRQFADLSVSYSPLERPLSVTFNALFADDSYTKSRLGLTGGDELRLGADLNWVINEAASVYFNVGLEDRSSKQFGSAALADRDWGATTDDDFISFGSGVMVRGISDNLDLQLDYTRTDGNSEIGIDSNAGTDAFPDLRTRFDQLRARLSYQHSERLQWELALRYQRFKAADWALEGVGPATLPVILGLGAQPYSPENYILGISVRYRIGPGAEAESG